jgi:hypothetical protein
MADDGPDAAIPPDLDIHFEAREPERDPTLGIAVDAGATRAGPAPHRLVVIGDSISHGFMSAAIFRTEVSWPAIVAYELGLLLAPPGTVTDRTDVFRYPVYEPPNGPGGLPFDIERFLKKLQAQYGTDLSFSELFKAAFFANRHLDAVEDFWERKADAEVPVLAATPHNLSVYGWDVRDILSTSYDAIAADLASYPAVDDIVPWRQLVDRDTSRAAMRVLGPAHAEDAGVQTAVDAATALGGHGGDGPGIETLCVVIGANNALASMLKLKVAWSGEDFADLAQKGKYTVWQPKHFAAEWAVLEARLRSIKARNLIVATVPSVTIAPVARGVPAKLAHGSRFFPNYTRPWIEPDAFDAKHDANITGDQARAIDSAVDAYNAVIIESVRRARRDGLNWFLFDLGGLLDSLASKRYLSDPAARPAWWREYPLPAPLQAMDPVPNTRFFRSGAQGRIDGGLFSLDGVHPTTIGYGIVAQEVIRIMTSAGVTFRLQTGDVRSDGVEVDWRRLLAADSLNSAPPALLDDGLGLLGWLDQRLDWVSGALGR